MSDDAIPVWGELLKGRVAALEQRLGTLEAGPDDEPVTAARVEPATAKGDDGENERRREELAALEGEMQSIQERLDQARKDADAAEKQTADARAKLDEQARAVQAEAAKLTLTRKMIECIWPPFMLTPPFVEWRTGIENALLQEATPPSAALLFANLHGYTACLLEPDLKYLRDVLRDISRFLYAWVKENGRDERGAFEVALTWAAQFNEECAGRCEIEVPEPGTPANSLSMTFPPRGSSPDVTSVRTWCVRDAQRRVIHRAEVFT